MIISTTSAQQTMRNKSIIWDLSLKHYRVFGSCSPATFIEKLGQVNTASESSNLDSSAAVFVDILRATTTLVAVAASGCRGIVVERKPSDGKYSFVAPFLPTEQWVFGGELNGGPISGYDLNGRKVRGVIDNSPLTASRSIFDHKYLRFFSTNGATAFEALSVAKFSAIYALSLANIEATAQALVGMNPARIWLVGGGFYGGATIEDSVAAGFLIKRLIELNFIKREELDDEAEAMRIHALYFHEGNEFLATELLTRLKIGQVARLLSKKGHEKDVVACINGKGMKQSWEDMKSVALVCRDMRTRLLVPDIRVVGRK
jgi:phosphosulfolactate phosphohydrolase-like enzyme